ncbi:hypothetical protein [Pedobacter sp. FW305-3-2-15-E-R2A2]|uniref:hypothetical protein n=1 Tax=Pedobacter sp. FW305-3-2-15-E-R2A2 TaxID=3140251 RepID=UPI00313FECBD
MSEYFLRINFADPNDPLSYTSVGSTKPGCPGTGKICSLLAENDGTGHPVITSQIQAQMVTALSTGVDQPLVVLRFLD